MTPTTLTTQETLRLQAILAKLVAAHGTEATFHDLTGIFDDYWALQEKIVDARTTKRSFPYDRESKFGLKGVKRTLPPKSRVEVICFLIDVFGRVKSKHAADALHIIRTIVARTLTVTRMAGPSAAVAAPTPMTSPSAPPSFESIAAFVIREESQHYLDLCDVLRLSGVCRAWRPLVRGTPELWTRLHGLTSQGMQNLPALLALSRDCDLSVAMTFRHSDAAAAALSALAAHLHRLVKMLLATQCDLKHAEQHFRFFFRQHAPELRSLDFRCPKLTALFAPSFFSGNLVRLACRIDQLGSIYLPSVAHFTAVAPDPATEWMAVDAHRMDTVLLAFPRLRTLFSEMWFPRSGTQGLKRGYQNGLQQLEVKSSAACVWSQLQQDVYDTLWTVSADNIRVVAVYGRRAEYVPLVVEECKPKVRNMSVFWHGDEVHVYLDTTCAHRRLLVDADPHGALQLLDALGKFCALRAFAVSGALTVPQLEALFRSRPKKLEELQLFVQRRRAPDAQDVLQFTGGTWALPRTFVKLRLTAESPLAPELSVSETEDADEKKDFALTACAGDLIAFINHHHIVADKLDVELVGVRFARGGSTDDDDIRTLESLVHSVITS